MDLLGPLLSVSFLVILIAVLAVLAERSLKRQPKGSLKRGRDERNAAGRIWEKYSRW